MTYNVVSSKYGIASPVHTADGCDKVSVSRTCVGNVFVIVRGASLILAFLTP